MVSGGGGEHHVLSQMGFTTEPQCTGALRGPPNLICNNVEEKQLIQNKFFPFFGGGRSTLMALFGDVVWDSDSAVGGLRLHKVPSPHFDTL